MKTTFIYILIDPITNEVRYVGKSNHPKKRLEVHLSKNNIKSHKTNWIQSLLKKDLKPILCIIDEVLIDEWKFWEVYWISQFKTWGFNLTNSTNGADGCTFSNITSFEQGHKPWNKDKKIKLKPNKNVYQYSAQTGEFIKQWDTARIASIDLKINEDSIAHCCRGIQKSSGGYIWKYVKQEKVEIMNNPKLKIKL